MLAQTHYTPPGSGFMMNQIFAQATGKQNASNQYTPSFTRQDHRQSQNTLPPIMSQSSQSSVPTILSRPSFLAETSLSQPLLKRPSSRNHTRPASPSSSEEEDPDPAIASASFPGPWRSMLSLAEAARLKADNQLTKEEAEGEGAADSGKGGVRDGAKNGDRGDGGKDVRPKAHPFDYGPGPDKKRRRSTMLLDDENTGLKGALPLLRGSQRHAYRDPVELGIISEGRGRELFES